MVIAMARYNPGRGSRQGLGLGQAEEGRAGPRERERGELGCGFAGPEGARQAGGRR
jgi:hypothetical protein